jgi:hypothetical protein
MRAKVKMLDVFIIHCTLQTQTINRYRTRIK